jgi:hypothetical protein
MGNTPVPVPAGSTFGPAIQGQAVPVPAGSTFGPAIPGFIPDSPSQPVAPQATGSISGFIPDSEASPPQPTTPTGSVSGFIPDSDAQSDLSYVNANMARALAGQPQSTPTGQQQFDAGKQAGTGTGAGIVASGMLGPALEFLGIGGGSAAAPLTEQVDTGLVDEYGQKIYRTVSAGAKQAASSILQQPVVQKAVKLAVKKIIGEEAGRRIGGAVGGTPGSIAGGGIGAMLGDRVLSWLLND